MLAPVTVVLIVQSFVLTQAVTATLEDAVTDLSPDFSTVYHHDLLRRFTNSTTACLPPVKQASLPSDCGGLTGCDAWCCETDQECCTVGGGGCMPQGAHNCGGRGFCDQDLLCCGLSTGNCYPPASGTCCGASGIWCPFGSECNCPITGCHCSSNSSSATSSSIDTAISATGVSGSTSESTSSPTDTGLSSTVQGTPSTSSHSSLTVSSSSTSQTRSAGSTNSTSTAPSSSGNASSNGGSTSAAFDCIDSSQLSLVLFTVYLIFIWG